MGRPPPRRYPTAGAYFNVKANEAKAWREALSRGIIRPPPKNNPFITRADYKAYNQIINSLRYSKAESLSLKSGIHRSFTGIDLSLVNNKPSLRSASNINRYQSYSAPKSSGRTYIGTHIRDSTRIQSSHSIIIHSSNSSISNLQRTTKIPDKETDKTKKRDLTSYLALGLILFIIGIIIAGIIMGNWLLLFIGLYLIYKIFGSH